jgi:hypothetical protein
MRPIPNPRHKSVLDRVDMNVVDMTREIVVITNSVFPITSLPDPALSFGSTALGNLFTRAEASREGRFDQPPASGKVGITFRKSPDRVQMIRQHNHRVDRKRMTPPCFTKRNPQLLDTLCQQPKTPVRQVDGEKEAAPSTKVAAIFGHIIILSYLSEAYAGAFSVIIYSKMGIAALHPSYGLT